MKRTHYGALFLFVPLFSSFATNAQDSKLQPYFAAAIVANIDSSISWYCNMLDLKQRNRFNNAERGYKQAILFNASTMIELVELAKGIPKDSLIKPYPQGSQGMGFSKFGFLVSDIDAIHSELEVKNAVFLGRMVTDGISKKRTFLIIDPDGNMIQFFER